MLFVADVHEDIKKLTGYSWSTICKRSRLGSFFKQYPRFLFTDLSMNELATHRVEIENFLEKSENKEEVRFWKLEFNRDYIEGLNKMGKLKIPESPLSIPSFGQVDKDIEEVRILILSTTRLTTFRIV